MQIVAFKCIIYTKIGGKLNMKNNLIKTVSLGMACLTLTLLLNVVTQKNIFKTLIPTQVHIIISPDEDAPWSS